MEFMVSALYGCEIDELRSAIEFLHRLMKQ